ncbi:MAG: LLM class flavin-dependent oxidoreductase [Chloroflexota bacterium]|nr:LLM class flavin-dependent oxidoreductase [Chloroflexota bacterium]
MKDHVEVFFHSQQPYIHVREGDLEKYDSGRLGFPNSYFDPQKAHILYNQYHEQYAQADEAGLDGIMTNEHHASYWNMKPSANIDAAVISRLTKKARIAILGNIIPINDPVRMAEELAMLDCYSEGRLISGFVRGGAVETLQAGISPTENRDRFEEAHDLIIKCWTEPGPFRFEGQYYQRRVVNPWVLPFQKPHPPVWFPGGSSPESVIWAAEHQYAYMNLGALIGLTQELKKVYIDTAKEVGFTPGPKHFGYQVRALVADTDEQAQEIGRGFLWAQQHRMRGPVEHVDPPGYQSRVASQMSTRRLGAGGGPPMTYQDLQDVNAVVVGSPETVIAKLKDTVEKLSPGYLILIGSDGNIPHKNVMRSLELLGSEVVPALHEVELQPYT